jgi:hypothetical protein
MNLDNSVRKAAKLAKHLKWVNYFSSMSCHACWRIGQMADTNYYQLLVLHIKINTLRSYLLIREIGG